MMFNIIPGAGATRTPDFLLMQEGEDITGQLSNRLIKLSMIDNREFVADQLDITLDDSDGLIELPARGAVLRLFLGWKGYALIGKGDFTVDEIEYQGAPDTVTIRARSADFRGSLNTRREESWHDTTFGAVVNTIAARNNLEARVVESLAGIKISHIDQSQESDAVFLTRLAQLNGAAVSVKAGRLLMLKAGSGTTVSGTPNSVFLIQRRDGDSHHFLLSERKAYTGVTAKWLNTRDPKPASQQEKITLKRKLKTPSVPAPQHPNAKAVSSQTAAKKQKAQDAREGEYLVGEANNVLALTTLYATKAQAMRVAQATWEKLQRGVAEFSITLASGQENIYPEMPVRVSGFKRAIDDNAWMISKVTHNIDATGFTSLVKLEVRISDAEYELDEGNE